MTPDPADQRDEDRHARRGGDEVLHRERGQLGQIAHGALAAVGLPVGVGGEAHGRVERKVGRHRPKPLRVEREESLQALNPVHGKESERVEEEHRQRVRLPSHLRVRRHPQDPIDETLDRAEQPAEEHGLALVHPRHVAAQRLGEQQQNGHIEAKLQPAVCGHENSSGLSSATNRYTKSAAEMTPLVQ
jgi:hypothetical protein